KCNRLINVFGGDQCTALGLPALTEGFQNAITPFAFWHHGYCAAFAIGPGTTGHFTSLVFCGEAELVQSWRAFSASIAVVQRQSSDRQLLAATELLDQWFLQRPDHQLHASGFCLAIELVHGGQARAVKHLNRRWVLTGLLRLIMSSHEAFAQRLGDSSQRPF